MSLSSKRSWLAPATALGLAIVAGCDQPGGPRPQTRAPGIVGVNLDDGAEPASNPAPTPPPTPPVEPKREPLLGRTTQDIGDAQKQTSGAPAPKQISKDPFRVYGNAYVSIISQASIGQIKHAVDLYQADTGEYPKTQDEFMEKIIKANNIRLPALPPYQKYVYDVSTHELGIWEYPELKN